MTQVWPQGVRLRLLTNGVALMGMAAGLTAAVEVLTAGVVVTAGAGAVATEYWFGLNLDKDAPRKSKMDQAMRMSTSRQHCHADVGRGRRVSERPLAQR